MTHHKNNNTTVMSKNNRKKVKEELFVVTCNDSEIDCDIYGSLSDAKYAASERLKEMRDNGDYVEEELYVFIYKLCKVGVAKATTKIIFKPESSKSRNS